MVQHMQVEASPTTDSALAECPSIRIDSLLSQVPLNDRMNADDAYARPFAESLQAGMSWYLAKRGLRVVSAGEDLRLTGAIERYEGFKGWGHWGVDVSLGFKVFRGAERLQSFEVRSILKYPDPGDVEDQEKAKYEAQGQDISFPEILFTRIGMDLSEKLIDTLKERQAQLGGGASASGTITQRGRLSIDATVQNAEVRIDGELIGTVPLLNIPLSSGKHSIEVRKKGFRTWREDVVVLPDAASHLTAELEPDTPSS